LLEEWPGFAPLLLRGRQDPEGAQPERNGLPVAELAADGERLLDARAGRRVVPLARVDQAQVVEGHADAVAISQLPPDRQARLPQAQRFPVIAPVIGDVSQVVERAGN